MTTTTEPTGRAPRTTGLVRRSAMRPRKALVKVHRWLSIGLLGWVIVISLTGAWLVVNDGTGALVHHDRYRATSGDVGPQAAMDAVATRIPKDATIYGVAMPSDGRGVYQVGYERAIDEEHERYEYGLSYVDPGSGRINATVDEEEGLTNWLYRGHMYLWQDHGIANAFDPEHGWCRAVHGAEPGGAKGVVCDVIPDGEDMVAWFAVAWIVVLVTGFYLWYWPGVRRWASALLIRRDRGSFAFHLSVHKVVGLLFWIPLTVIAFTGMAFAFPNVKAWYQNVTPAERGMELWTAPDSAYASGDADGRTAMDLDRFVEVLHDEYPSRTVQYVMAPADETGTYTAWVSRGFDPWTREGGAGNAYVAVDQYSGEVLYDGTPEDGNVFDQAWDDWSFPVHAGDFGGTATRLVWVLVGLSPLVLAVTGVAMNLIRRAKRAKRAARSGVAERPVPSGAPSGGAAVVPERTVTVGSGTARRLDLRDRPS